MKHGLNPEGSTPSQSWNPSAARLCVKGRRGFAELEMARGFGGIKSYGSDLDIGVDWQINGLCEDTV